MYIPITTFKRALEYIPNKEYVYEGKVFPTFRYPLIDFTITFFDNDDKETVSYNSYELEFRFNHSIDDWEIDVNEIHNK